MEKVPDHPVIRACEQTGYPTTAEWPVCPICGRECSTVYKVFRDIVGCDECITAVDAWEEEECFE